MFLDGENMEYLRSYCTCELFNVLFLRCLFMFVIWARVLRISQGFIYAAVTQSAVTHHFVTSVTRGVGTEMTSSL